MSKTMRCDFAIVEAQHQEVFCRKGANMTAKQYLDRLLDIAVRIECKQIEKEKWETIAAKTTTELGGERVQSSPSPQKMENAAIEAVEIAKEISELKRQQREIIKTIEQVKDRKLLKILHKKYVEGLSNDQICYSSKISKSTFKRRLARAYDEVQKIIDEVEYE